MSLIKDVKAELASLDTSSKALRKFGFVVGGMMALVGFLLYNFGVNPNIYGPIGGVGAALLALAIFYPAALRPAQCVWMGFAFVLGWIVSRILLTIVFFLVVFPVGLVAQLSGKKFLVEFNKSASSYWIPKQKRPNASYEKMH